MRCGGVHSIYWLGFEGGTMSDGHVSCPSAKGVEPSGAAFMTRPAHAAQASALICFTIHAEVDAAQSDQMEAKIMLDAWQGKRRLRHSCDEIDDEITMIKQNEYVEKN